MNWKELIVAAGTRAQVPGTTSRAVLEAFVQIVQAEVAAGNDVAVRGLGVFGLKVRKPRTLRTVSTGRKMLVGERKVPQFRAAAQLKSACDGEGTSLWRDPEYQAAWRRVETLIADLQTYHGSDAPKGLTAEMSDDEVVRACDASLGAPWRSAVEVFEQQTPTAIRLASPWLADAARRRWGSW